MIYDANILKLVYSYCLPAGKSVLEKYPAKDRGGYFSVRTAGTVKNVQFFSARCLVNIFKKSSVAVQALRSVVCYQPNMADSS